MRQAALIPFVRLAVILFCTAILLPTHHARAQQAQQLNGSVTLNWLDSNPPVLAGVSWGVPWPRGAVQKTQTFTLIGADGKVLPLQAWPLAYWPDGSIKWTGFSTVAGPDAAGPLKLSPGQGEAVAGPIVQVTESDDAIDVDTGALTSRIPKRGPVLIDSMTIDGREVARRGQLQCILQKGPETDRLNLPSREQYVGHVNKVTVEQGGPVRAVVKLEGMHKSQSGSREWLPFVVRFYFYAGQQSVRMVHTIIFDGDQEKDFIRGMGLVFDVPFREEVQNRHVRFSNSNGGLFAEPVLLPGGGRRGSGPGGRGTDRDGGPEQLDGERMGPTSSELARWDAFRLVQTNSEGFTIVKRANPESTWLAAGEGHRASGLVFVGDVTGGIAVGVKDFWQSYPASLEVQKATSDAAELAVWLWSPDGPAMDLRHYDTRGHGPVNGGSGSYEDYEAGFDTPVGVARTSELTLYPTANVPSRQETANHAAASSAPPLLTCTPEYLHSTGIFGIWSLPDRSTPFKKEIEDRLDAAIGYYQKAIDQHHWYGYWDFGDVRHQYDARRHVWRYDVGGYAWDNTELGSVLWVWYSYIRTGRSDVFRMAEAMIRHTGEVDTYHLGRFAGLGSRHNVSHWGDSAKEARVSQAAHGRFYYYLTTDERTGDVLREVTSVDAVASALDPMRKADPPTEAEKKYPGRIRVGPDWLAFIGNWMTEWERTGDTKWRDKIMAGVDSLYGMQYWMRSGRNLVVGYDPATGKMFQVNDQPGVYNLATIQGGGEVAFELVDLLSDEKWTKIWLQYCRLGSAPADVLIRDKATGTEGSDASMMGEQGGASSQGTPRLAAYAYYRTKNPAFGPRALSALTSFGTGRGFGGGETGEFGVYTTRRIEGPETLNPIDEAAGVSTNTAAQSSLTAIEVLELCKDQIPATRPPAPPPGERGGVPATAPAQETPSVR